MLTSQIFDIYVKTGFGIKLQTIVDMPENQTKTKTNLQLMVKLRVLGFEIYGVPFPSHYSHSRSSSSSSSSWGAIYESDKTVL